MLQLETTVKICHIFTLSFAKGLVLFIDQINT